MIQNILGLLPIKIWKGIIGIRDLAEILSGIRENAKILDGRLGKRDSPNSCTGKKTIFGVEITKAREKGEGMRAHRTPFLTLAHENTI